MSQRHPLAKTAFSASGASGQYDKARPTYPLEAVSRVLSCLPEQDAEVVELGAGTGIFTRALLSNAKDGQIKRLRAVEPAAGMRVGFGHAMNTWKKALSAGKPVARFDCTDGTFDDMHLIDPDSADLVVAAQAWHWTGSELIFQDECIQEVSRVLKRGGYFALIWNLKDREAADWVGSFRDAYEVHEAGTPQYRRGFWKCLFHTTTFRSSFALLPPQFSAPASSSAPGPPQSKVKNVDDSIDSSPPTLTVKRSIPMTLEMLYERVLTKSYITELEPETQKNLKDEFEAIWKFEVVGDPSVKWIDDKTIEFPYVTHLYLMRKQ